MNFDSLPNRGVPISYSPILWNRLLPEKLTGPQLVKKFPAFYGTRRFITVYTSGRHLSLSWASSIQSMPPFPFLKIHFHIIFPSIPRSSKWFFYLQVPHQNPVCTSPVPHMCHIIHSCHSSWFDHPNHIWWGVEIMKLLQFHFVKIPLHQRTAFWSVINHVQCRNLAFRRKLVCNEWKTGADVIISAALQLDW